MNKNSRFTKKQVQALNKMINITKNMTEEEFAKKIYWMWIRKAIFNS